MTKITQNILVQNYINNPSARFYKDKNSKEIIMLTKDSGWFSRLWAWMFKQDATNRLIKQYVQETESKLPTLLSDDNNTERKHTIEQLGSFWQLTCNSGKAKVNNTAQLIALYAQLQSYEPKKQIASHEELIKTRIQLATQTIAENKKLGSSSSLEELSNGLEKLHQEAQLITATKEQRLAPLASLLLENAKKEGADRGYFDRQLQQFTTFDNTLNSISQHIDKLITHLESIKAAANNKANFESAEKNLGERIKEINDIAKASLASTELAQLKEAHKKYLKAISSVGASNEISLTRIQALGSQLSDKINLLLPKYKISEMGNNQELESLKTALEGLRQKIDSTGALIETKANLIETINTMISEINIQIVENKVPAQSRQRSSSNGISGFRLSR